MTKVNRLEKIEIRVTHDEKEKIRRIAKHSGITLSAWCRRQLLKQANLANGADTD